ncbi:unnamed protein product [Eruca vesicaria subsp. sativa]|uniref:pectinesterase n=1 Tax=Eruca vesicaria subsp. sativa TaxID=29727 RepID=A0ABC8K0S7_ERUVS|nr:unnamed protein product [Eruca vesicaria subsp. sativa]
MAPSIKQIFSKDSFRKHKKLVSLSAAVALLLVTAVAGITIGASKTNENRKITLSPSSHAVLTSACSSTRYPELCFSSVATSSGVKLSSQKDVIEASLNLTKIAVEHNYFTVKKLIKNRKGLTPREKTALHDCLETIDVTLDELHEAVEDLHLYPNKKSLREHAGDLKTLISSAITNQETCLDGFSHDRADKNVRKALLKGQMHVEHMCSNALAMIKNMTDTDIANFELKAKLTSNNRKLKEEETTVAVDIASAGELDAEGWPTWLSAGDRRLLQGSTVEADATVAADGSGTFTTVAAAVAAAPENSNKRYVIHIKAGVYRENVDVPKKKKNIMFMGDGRTTTIITASRNVVDGSTTFHSATVAAVGERFLARDITFQNTAGPSKHQAVALRVGSDFSAFYRCDMLAYQDTLYVHSNRQFFVNCLIAGTVDFIFGNAAVVLQNCDIHARRPNSGQKNMVTAQGRTDPNQNTGIVIQNCRIGATSDLMSVKSSFPTYLGRPWKEYSQTVIMKSDISDVIRPEGWFEWSGTFALSTLTYREYANTGAGAGTGGRVKWNGFKVITDVAEAEPYTAGQFIGGGGWLASTGFPFSLGYFKVDEEAQEIALKKKAYKRLFLVAASVVILLGVIIGGSVAVARNQRNSSHGSSPNTTPELTPAASLKNVCSVTRFPDACISSISKIPSSNTTDPEVIFKLSLKVVVDELASISDLPRKLAEETDDEGIKSALSVCGEMLDVALDSVNETVSAMDVGDGNNILTSGKIDDLKTWLTAAITYYETCFDTLAEISPNQTESKTSIVSQNLTSAMRNSTEFTSNSLVIVAKILSTLSDFNIPIHRRRLLSSNSFPSWVSPRVRRLLAAKSVTPNVTVAADGSGDVWTVNEAVVKIPKKSNATFVIYVKAGTYVENVVMDKSMWNVMIYGDGKDKTIISGSKNFGVDGIKTYYTATLGVQGKGFIMKDIGIINTAGPEKSQAVAFRSDSDQSVYYQCSFDGYQDTLYTHAKRQFYRDCDVTGTVDFIFGNAAVIFQSCTIRPRQPLPKQSNTITAQGRTEEKQNSGTVIQGCTITANGNVTAATYLGRPWKQYSTTVIMESEIGPLVGAAGWLRWDTGVDPPSTILYGEYKNSGLGAGLTERVDWAGYKPSMSASEAGRFTVDAFIDGKDWLPATGVPYQPSFY